MSDPQERLHRLADGAADYVVKPFLIDELALKLFNLIRGSEEEKRVQALERKRAFEAFLAGLAHAIRNPLSTVTGPIANLRKLLEGSGASFDHERIDLWLRYAEEGAARIVKTLADAELVLSRPVLKLCPLDVLVLAYAVVNARQASLVVAVNVTPGLKVMGDAKAAQRILENLLSSAAAAIGGRGEVEISAERIPGSGSQSLARITVSHAGASPDPATAARMFEPFFSARPRESAIALYAAKEVAAGMGWDIRVGVATEGRAGFTVTAPLS